MADNVAAEQICLNKGIPKFINNPLIAGGVMINPAFLTCVNQSGGNVQPVGTPPDENKTVSTIAADTAAILQIAQLFQRTPEQQQMVAACGPRPLFGADKKQKYQQCIQNFMGVGAGAGYQAPGMRQQQTGMSTGAKIAIAIGFLLLIIVIIILIIKMNKKK